MASGLSVTDNDEIIVSDLGLDQVNVFNGKGRKLISLNNLPADEPSKAIKSGENFIVACKSGLKVFDDKGNFGRKIKSCVEFPQGLACNHNGDIIVTDSDENGRGLIHMFARADIRKLHSIIGGNRAPIFTKPWYTAVNEDNNILVSDYHEHCVKILNPIGMLMREFGHKGHEPGCFFHPAGLCVDRYGHILVADCYNNRVQMFDKDGYFLGIILNEENDISYPSDLSINSEGHLVLLQGNGEVRVYQYIF